LAELRRLLIKRSRIENLNKDLSFDLFPQEAHYLTRVLRLKNGGLFLITDGLGNLWKATLTANNKIILRSSLHEPLETKPCLAPLICLAVVIPKKGFSDILRMSSEIGIDVFQPLISERSVNKGSGKERTLRWESILHEAIEQSERLWKPELRTIKKFNDWVINHPSDVSSSIGAARQNSFEKFESWLLSVPVQCNEVWITIGPEGGWTNDELRLAIDHAFKGVCFGDTIMRTSTAAISASQLMASWKRMIK